MRRMMRWMKPGCGWAMVVALLLAFAGASSAALVEISYTGSVAELEPTFEAGLPPGTGIVVGAPVVVTYEFETTTADTEPQADTGIYSGAVSSWTMQIGSYIFTQKAGGSRNEIDILFDMGLIIFEPITSVTSSPTIAGQSNLESDIFFMSVDTQSPPLADDSLPAVAQDPLDAAWTDSRAGLLDGSGVTLIDIDLDAICTVGCALPTPSVPLGVAGPLALTLTFLGSSVLARSSVARKS